MDDLIRYGGDYLLRDFLDGRMSAASIRDFNDPFELHLKPGRMPTRKEALERTTQIHDRNREMNEMIAIVRGVKVSVVRKAAKKLKGSRFFEDNTPDLIEKQRAIAISRADEAIKVMCCAEATDPHPGEIPMWGYYADGHRGVRLHFRSSFYTQHGVLVPQVVDYDNDPVEFGFPEMTGEGMRSFIDKVLKTKSSAWNHEREVRLLIAISALQHAKDTKGTMRWWLPVKPDDVSRIDLGVKFSNPDLLTELRDRVPHLPIFQASKNPEKFLCNYSRIAP